MTTTRAWPWDSPAVRYRNIRAEATGGARPASAAAVRIDPRVRRTTGATTAAGAPPDGSACRARRRSERPCASAPSSQAVSQRVVHEVDDHLSGRNKQPGTADRRSRRPASDPHADTGGVDHDVGTAMSPTSPTAATVGEARRASAASIGACDSPPRCRVGARSSERVDHRAGRAPAPMTATRAPATSMPISASEATNPAPSVLDPISCVAVPADRVDRLQCARRGIEPIDGFGHRLLVRHRDRQPADAEHPHRVDGAAAFPGATSKAT